MVRSLEILDNNVKNLQSCCDYSSPRGRDVFSTGKALQDRAGKSTRNKYSEQVAREKTEEEEGTHS